MTMNVVSPAINSVLRRNSGNSLPKRRRENSSRRLHVPGVADVPAANMGGTPSRFEPPEMAEHDCSVPTDAVKMSWPTGLRARPDSRSQSHSLMAMQSPHGSATESGHWPSGEDRNLPPARWLTDT